MEEQSDTPRTEMAEGQRLNPYFEGRFDGESDELCALRLTLARERDEALARVSDLVENGERLKAVADSAVRDAADMAEAKCEPLRDQIHQLQFDQQWAFDLAYRIRQALGDNGRMMQDELIEHCRKLVADAKEGEDLRKRERVDEVEALGNTIRELYARATGETE